MPTHSGERVAGSDPSDSGGVRVGVGIDGIGPPEKREGRFVAKVVQVDARKNTEIDRSGELAHGFADFRRETGGAEEVEKMGAGEELPVLERASVVGTQAVLRGGYDLIGTRKVPQASVPLAGPDLVLQGWAGLQPIHNECVGPLPTAFSDEVFNGFELVHPKF